MDQPSASQVKIKLAIIASLLSSLSLTVMLTLSKVALASSSINQVSFFRNLFSMTLSIIFVICSGRGKNYFSYLKTKQLNIHIIRSLSGIATIYLFLLALQTISLAEATLLFNSTPLFVPLIAYLWKKTPINHKIWPGLIIAFAGMFFLLQPENVPSNIGILSGLAAGAIGSITILAVRFSQETEPAALSLFYYGLFSVVFSGLIYSMEGFSLTPLYNSETLLPLIGVGIAGFCCQIFFTLSVKYAPAKLIAPFAYLAVIFGLWFDQFFWGTHILLSQVMGMLLILLGLYLVVFFFHRTPSETLDPPKSPK